MSRKYDIIYARLAAIAAILPALPVFTGETDEHGNKLIKTRHRVNRVTGAMWLKIDPHAQIDGKIPELTKRYKLTSPAEPVVVDHDREIKKTFKASGVEGVNKYIQICYEFNKQDRPEDLVFSID